MLIKSKVMNELHDFVKVGEVQDALKKMNDGLARKFENILEKVD